MNQQELADAIGINMQSLSKIERGVNFPTFDTLEKITSVLGVTPNELLCGEWKNTSHMEQEILKFLECEERLNVELAHGQYDNYFDSEEEWKEYMQKITIQGRGGTDFRPVFELIRKEQEKRELRNLKALIYFTDGDGIYPRQKPDYETAFVFVKKTENMRLVPDWAYKLVIGERTKI